MSSSEPVSSRGPVSGGGPVSGRGLGRAVAAVVVRPGLWATALRQVRLLARPGWWRRSPYLPVPDADYLRFRLQTAYGDPEREPEPEDLVTYLHWCKSWPRLTS